MTCMNCGAEMAEGEACECSPTYCAKCCQCGPNCELCNCSASKAKSASSAAEEEMEGGAEVSASEESY